MLCRALYNNSLKAFKLFSLLSLFIVFIVANAYAGPRELETVQELTLSTTGVPNDALILENSGIIDSLLIAVHEIKRLKNDGAGFFIENGSIDNGVAQDPEGLALGHFDTDGEIDLVSINGGWRKPASISLMKGTGNLEFGKPKLTMSNEDGIRFPTPLDLQNDGMHDLLAVVRMNPDTLNTYIELYSNKYTSFSLDKKIPLPNITHLTAGDVDNDGIKDLVATINLKGNKYCDTNYGCSAVVAVALNAQLDPTFYGVLYPNAKYKRLNFEADIDSNGKSDLLVVGEGYSQVAKLYKFNLNGSVKSEPLSDLRTTGGGYVTVADVDGDGQLDALIPKDKIGSDLTIHWGANNTFPSSNLSEFETCQGGQTLPGGAGTTYCGSHGDFKAFAGLVNASGKKVVLTVRGNDGFRSVKMTVSHPKE